jgi:hypothetical protein
MNIKKDEIWDICANFVHMVELILISLRAFDGKQPCMVKGMASHENIGMTCFIIMRSII